MLKADCIVGAMVVCVRPFAGLKSLVGKTGTIVVAKEHDSGVWNIGVDFDEPFDESHNCGGYAANGRWGEASSLEPITEEITISFKEFLNNSLGV